MVKISEFMVAIVIVCAVLTIFITMVTTGSNYYDTQFNETNINTTKLNQSVANIDNLTTQFKKDADNLSSNDGVFDILGNLFNQGYTSLKITYQSVSLFTGLASDSTQGMTQLGTVKDIVIGMVITIIGILIFIGVIGALIVKWPI